MSPDLALLRCVLAEPSADWPRLQYADAVMEQSAEGHDRGEFIQIQIQLSKPPACEKTSVPPKSCRNLAAIYPKQHWCRSCREGHPEWLRRRERELLEATPNGIRNVNWWAIEGGLPTDHVAEWVWRRGFVESVSLTWEAWGGGACSFCDDLHQRPNCACRGSGRIPGHAAAILAAQPVRRVRLTTLPVVEQVEHRPNATIPGYVVRFAGREKTILFAYGTPYEDMAPLLFAAEWPGITLELPTAQHGLPMAGAGSGPADVDFEQLFPSF